MTSREVIDLKDKRKKYSIKNRIVDFELFTDKLILMTDKNTLVINKIKKNENESSLIKLAPLKAT